MPSVFVVPVYVEVPAGFERSVMALESHLRRAGYIFHIGEPLFETLEQTKKALLGAEQAEYAQDPHGGTATVPELADKV